MSKENNKLVQQAKLVSVKKVLEVMKAADKRWFSGNWDHEESSPVINNASKSAFILEVLLEINQLEDEQESIPDGHSSYVSELRQEDCPPEFSKSLADNFEECLASERVAEVGKTIKVPEKFEFTQGGFMKVEIFNGSDIQDSINEFFENNKDIDVKHTKQFEAGTISIFYTKKRSKSTSNKQ